MIWLGLILILLTNNSYSIEKNLKIKPREISMVCDRQGYPKADALKALITAHHLNTISQNQIYIKEMKGGFYTEKMYLVTVKKNRKKIPLFFFKISKKSNSTKNLIQIQEGPIGEKFLQACSSKSTIPSHIKKQLPVIIWLKNVFTYTNKTGETKTIEVSPSAQGTLVQDILDSENISDIKEAGYALGKSLAAFHQVYMNDPDSPEIQNWQTVYHGDFSVKNTLFDATTKKVYFIDNEGMQQGSIAQDIRTISISLLMFRYLQKNYSKRWPMYLDFCISFLKGYIETYPVSIQAHLALCIEKIMTEGLRKALCEKIIKDPSIDRKKFNEKEFMQAIHNCLHKFHKNNVIKTNK